jgi:hypothetical protein
MPPADPARSGFDALAIDDDARVIAGPALPNGIDQAHHSAEVHRRLASHGLALAIERIGINRLAAKHFAANPLIIKHMLQPAGCDPKFVGRVRDGQRID